LSRTGDEQVCHIPAGHARGEETKFDGQRAQAVREASEEGLTEEEVQAEIETIKQQVYAERYGRG